MIKHLPYLGELLPHDSFLEFRNRHFLFLDILLLIFLPTLALSLRVDSFNWWAHFGRPLILFSLVALIIKILIFYRLGLYRRYWCYAGITDLTFVVTTVCFSTLILTLFIFAALPYLAKFNLILPRSLVLIDGMLTGFAVVGTRFGFRAAYYYTYQASMGGRRTLIVGAGEAGTMVVREIRTNPQLNMEPVAFVDDAQVKIGTHIEGLLVLGPCDSIPEIVKDCNIQRIIVAMPSAPLGRRKSIASICSQTAVATDILPGVYELLAGNKTISKLPKLDINRLLHREPTIIDQRKVAMTLETATVLVTGAGGSIGSELCRQIARFNPREIILLGHGENSIFEIDLDLHLSLPNLISHPVIVDVRDKNRIDWVIEKYRPDVIFHAAAHKHVHFMETNVAEAITNNVLGTYNILQAAERYGVEQFILISTDKAVNPTTVMGATKRIAELLTVSIARRSGRAYMAVRFGNVLGSRGSVIPVFQRQIAAGGPLTVTHPDMSRYFMTIPEAVQLVLQAIILGQGGEIFVLDMGQPVQILKLATDLIQLSGLKPEHDIKIIYTGARPGEKLDEELFLTREAYQRTSHPKCFVAPYNNTVEAESLEYVVSELIDLIRDMQAQSTSTEDLRTLLLQICHYIDI